MPKIDAPTVVEHHARRRADLLRAAAAIVADRGVEALTLAEVGRAAGLARSSVYQYFDSAPAVVAALVEDLLPRSVEHLASVTQQAGEPRARIAAFVVAAVEAAADPIHRAVAALATASLPDECSDRLAELHDRQVDPLRAALRDLAIPDPDLTAALIMGVVYAAAGAAERRPLDVVTQHAVEAVDAMVAATG